MKFFVYFFAVCLFILPPLKAGFEDEGSDGPAPTRPQKIALLDLSSLIMEMDDIIKKPGTLDQTRAFFPELTFVPYQVDSEELKPTPPQTIHWAPTPYLKSLVDWLQLKEWALKFLIPKRSHIEAEERLLTFLKALDPSGQLEAQHKETPFEVFSRKDLVEYTCGWQAFSVAALFKQAQIPFTLMVSESHYPPEKLRIFAGTCNPLDYPYWMGQFQTSAAQRPQDRKSSIYNWNLDKFFWLNSTFYVLGLFETIEESLVSGTAPTPQKALENFLFEGDFETFLQNLAQKENEELERLRQKTYYLYPPHERYVPRLDHPRTRGLVERGLRIVRQTHPEAKIYVDPVALMPDLYPAQ